MLIMHSPFSVLTGTFFCGFVVGHKCVLLRYVVCTFCLRIRSGGGSPRRVHLFIYYYLQ